MSARDGGASDVGIYEVGPRDGLQNEVEFVPTVEKRELIARLVAAGLRGIEVASFVQGIGFYAHLIEQASDWR